MVAVDIAKLAISKNLLFWNEPGGGRCLKVAHQPSIPAVYLCFNGSSDNSRDELSKPSIIEANLSFSLNERKKTPCH